MLQALQNDPIGVVGADRLHKVIHDRDGDVLSGEQSVSGILNDLRKGGLTMYEDETFDVVAIDQHPEGEVPIIGKLYTSRNGVPNFDIDIGFVSIKRDHRRLF